ncbi:MAG: pyruvate, phosphate dikinase [Roseateles depolymerans]|uniref:Pyruvate, phosphate dikinase n=1 Tax=Roseateles depolymerans TaxID=76731 RepID=A0A2W5DQ44_9BURK|nr:MAG: pyruvate, phosphate dikinase [Roseateles depolymerans]
MTAMPPAVATVWHPELFAFGCDALPALPEPTPERLGFKAYNLQRMALLGLPVPPAFVLGTGLCASAATRAAGASAALWGPGLAALEQATGLRLGDPRRPLLLSVRSGAPVSMPGMMETLLNIGLSDATLDGFIRQTGQPRLAWDAYRRLVAGFGEIVAGIPAQRFEAELAAFGPGRSERELDFAELRALTRRCLAVYAQAAGRPFPQDPREQLQQAIAAVFGSWQSDKARAYRAAHHISDAIGTAVTVQTMVFGNAGVSSGAGVGFTRDPSSGANALWVDFLFNAQGEDVVSGRRSAHGHAQLAEVLPEVWAQLHVATALLESAFGDMQDFEFTVQQGRLYLLQTRSGKRTPQAAARIALDLLAQGLIDADTARERTAALDEPALALLRVVASDGAPLQPLASAAAASAGVAVGEIAFDAARAAARRADGAEVILVRRDAETADMAALQHATGLLTQRGARTSHAAVVARQMGRVCLVGCEALQLDEQRRELRVGEQVLAEGALITLDGNEGQVYAGAAQTQRWVDPALLDGLARLRAGDAG